MTGPGYAGPGPSLAEMVGRYGPLPVGSVLTLAAGLAAALRAIHGAGVVHGDLQPGCVLLAPDGPRITGISQAAGYPRPAAAPAPAGFTPPERVAGGPAGPPGDIFGLGAVLVYAATARPPLEVRFFAADPGGIPGELRPLVERCLAGNPADRPSAEQFLAYLAAAHPEAISQAGWAPAGRLAQTTPPTLDFPAVRAAKAARTARADRTDRADRAGQSLPAGPPFPAAPAAPAVSALPADLAGQFAPGTLAAPAAPKRRMSRRRRAWLTASAAVLAAAAAAAGLLAAWPRPALRQPTSLTVLSKTPWSVTLGWQANRAGLRPAGYQVMENGKRLATVPPATTRYQVLGLTSKTAYRFAVVAVRGTRLAPSATIAAGTIATPPLADAGFPWSGYVTYRETFSSDSYFKKLGATWQDDWSITSDCGWQACGKATLTGAIDNIGFTARLTRSGGTYQGSAPIDDYWLDCEHQSDYEDTTLYVKIAVTSAGPVYQQHWTVTGFKGAATWDVPALPDGCTSSLYKMDVSGLEPVAGVSSP